MKTIQTALVFCATLLALAQTAQAQCPYEFSTNDGTITIDYYSGQATVVNIPGTINGLPVTSIAANAFGDDENLYSVTIPTSITNIAENEFADMQSLTSIVVDSGNPCYSSVDGVLFNLSQTILIQFPAVHGGYTVPNGVTNIGPGAFEGLELVSTVTIPASVTSFGEGAFANSGSLNSVYCEGNAPTADSTVFAQGIYDNVVTVYYLLGTTGWDDFAANTGNPVVLWNPLIQAGGANFGVQNNQFGFNITGTNDFTVVVLACTNLANPVWTPLQTVTINNGSYYFTDPDWSNYPVRFYGLTMP